MFKRLLIVFILIFMISLLNASFVSYEIFSNYDVASTVYVYDEAGSTNPHNNDKNSDGAYRIEVVMSVVSINATSIDFIVQCVMPNATYDDVFTYSFTSAGDKLVVIGESCSSVALGVKVTGDAGVQSVSGYIYVERR